MAIVNWTASVMFVVILLKGCFIGVRFVNLMSTLYVLNCLKHFNMSYISVDLFGTSLRASATTQLVKNACDFCEVKDFCYNVMGENPEANRATTRYNLEDVTIQLAYTNYTNIHRKVLTVTSNEVDPTLKQMYKQCLHDYVLLKSDFDFIIHTLVTNGDMGQAIEGAQTHLFACMSLFTQSPTSPNPFAQDNDNLAYFLELIRDISFIPLI